MSTCVFPGSFDPVTRGHMDVITRAARLFDQVTVAVMVNVRKAGVLAPEDRVRLLEKACAGILNVRVVRWDGLLADYMRESGERCLIRGVRGTGEFDAEITSAQVNRLLNPDVETLLIPASDGMSAVSSSAVREIAAFGGDIRAFVPECVAEELQERLKVANPGE